MSFKHSFPIQTRFNDFDLVGHIYNGTYQDFFDTARLHYFKTALQEELNWEKTGLVIVSTQNDFSLPVYPDDKIEIQTRVCVLGKKSLQMIQHVTKNGGKEPVATSKTVLVCFDTVKKESVLIPAEWREKLAEFEPDLIGE